MAVSFETVAKALFVNYESIYDINMETGQYCCFYESESYERLRIEKRGENFFEALIETIPRIIAENDQKYVEKMLSKEALIAGTENDEYYSFIYRVKRDKKDVYHKVRAKREVVDDVEHVYLGVRDVDSMIRRERAHSEEIQSLLMKEQNHMNAILASAEGYLEIDLTLDIVVERFCGLEKDQLKPLHQIPDLPELRSYSEMMQHMRDTLLATNHDAFDLITKREYILDSFERGERRVSLDYSLRTENGERQPCRQVYYLYYDKNSEHVMCFCVVYDLSEQQDRMKEKLELEHQLQLARIRCFTGQMQPHFLYNALGSIQEIMLEDPAYASSLLDDFTTYLRGCIRSMGKDDPIPFSQELENIYAYVNIEKMRFGSKLNVVYNIESDAFPILPLSVQPLVENAIRHGIYQRGKKGGTVTICAEKDEHFASVTIKDDGVGFDYDKYREEMKLGERESAGIQNVMFRLENVLNAEVVIQSTVDVGTDVLIRIPIREAGERDENDHSG